MTAALPTSTPVTVNLDEQPAIRRKFQFVSLGGNNNKWWMIEAWPQGGDYRVRVTYGREGRECARPYEYIWSRGKIESKIAEQLKEGYTELDLHQVQEAPAAPAAALTAAPSAAAPAEPKVEQLIKWIFAEAGEAIKTFLKVKVDSLSRTAIADGRKLLREIEQIATPRVQAEIAVLASREDGVSARDKVAIAQVINAGSPDFRALMKRVEDFYRVIPTNLPAAIRPVATVREFLSDLAVNPATNSAELYDRLDQLEAALNMVGVTATSSSGSQYGALGATLTLLPDTDPRHAAIKAEFLKTNDWYNRRLTGMKLKDIFQVCIPGERAAFEANTRGKHNVRLRWHGSRNQNVRHILKSGLVVPTSYTNGWAFGRGIYLASQSQKSQQYCGTANYRSDVPHMMFAVDAALGTLYKPRRSDSSLVVPAGYDSIHADPSVITTLANDEFIVPTAAQCTIRYILTFHS